MAPRGNTARESGNARPKNVARSVVFLHGWGSGAPVWKDLAAELAPSHPVHAPDLPGYGATPVCAPYTLDGIATEMARSAPERCDVIGWSLGAQIALRWAQRAPRQVMRLALIAATPCFAQRADWPHAVVPEALARFSKGLATDRAGTLQRFISLEAQGDEKAKQVARQLRAASAARDGSAPEALLAGLGILRETDLRGALGAISQPVLVMHGDRDSLAPLAAGEYLSRCLPNARLMVLRGAGHAPFISQAHTVAAALRAFLDE